MTAYSDLKSGYNIINTRKALLLAIMLMNTDQDGYITLTHNELVKLFEETKVISGKYVTLRIKHDLQKLEEEGILVRFYRLEEYRGKPKIRLGMHYYYRFDNLQLISKYIDALPVIPNKTNVKNKIRVLYLQEMNKEK